jgi:hypothetical protein
MFVMRSLVAVLIAVAVTFLCWGIYGPVLHVGQLAMRTETGPSSLRPFICVGMAYFLIAVVVPVGLLYTKKEKGHWSIGGAIWSLAAGTVGAVGALGIIWAFKARGNPVYVMPLVFGLAPVVNTFVTMYMTHTYRKASKIFFAAVIVVAVGAAGVLVFKPKPQKPSVDGESVTVEEPDDGTVVVATPAKGGEKSSVVFQSDGRLVVTITSENAVKQVFPPLTAAALAADPEYREAFETYQKAVKPHLQYLRSKPLGIGELAAVIASIAMTALCWGSYGPVLHKGQTKMAGSRLRPFLCVGLAYFAIAVVVPCIILSGYDEPGKWTFGGVVWSLIAGAAGAVGALGIIMAFNFGGKPIYVMPLVFGGAPVVNTITSVVHDGTLSMIGTPFLVSLLMVIVGAACVLLFAPKPGKKGDDAAGVGKPKKEPVPAVKEREPVKETTKEEMPKDEGMTKDEPPKDGKMTNDEPPKDEKRDE